MFVGVVEVVDNGVLHLFPQMRGVAHSLGTDRSRRYQVERVDAQRRRRPASAEPEHLQHDGYATGFAAANDAFQLAMACASIAGK